MLHGARAYVRVDQSRPTIAMGLFFHGGRLFEDESNYGITELMLRTMWRSVKSRWDYQTGEEVPRGQEVTLSAEQVIMKLEQLGGQLRWVNEPDFFGFILHVLSRNQDQALRLLVDIVERPLFDETEVQRARAELLYELRHRSPRPVDLAWRALVGEHVYSVPPWGRVETVEQLTPERLRDWHRQTIGRQYPLVIIVGDTDGSTLISTIIARQFHRREIQRTFRAQIPQLPPAPRQQTATSRTPALAIGFLVPAHQVVEREIFDVIEQILVGPGGQLTESLRDRRGLAYRVGARFDPRALASAFFIWMTPRATGQAEALAEVRRYVQRLVTGPMDEEMVALGINAAISAQRDRLQAHPARVLAYARRAFLGERPVDVEHYAERLGQLTGQKIHAVAAQYLKWERRGVGRLQGPSRPRTTPPSPVTDSEEHRPSSAAFR
ncbi:MAG: insulinase family protein [Acidobacteria bacterium]|nr:MAG: insulinase family protein [Acidobacteriota bacterium]